MKKVLVAVVTLFLAFPVFAKGGRHGGSHAGRGGHYAGGKGLSHKGGHYKNAQTGDHYQKKNK